ncbi:MAG: PH domain-containing protein [Nitriliruptor sp.]
MPSDPSGAAPPPPPPGGSWPPATGGSSPPPGDAGFTIPRALHPASIVLGVPLRQLVQGLVLPAVIGAGAGPGFGFAAIVVGLLLLVTGVGRVLAWRRFRFSFDGEVLRVDEGVVSRNHRALDVARIQQVEVERSLASRLLGLATLRVETAGGSGEAEIELRVVPEADAVALREAIRAGREAALGPSADTGRDADLAGGPARAEAAGHEVIRMSIGRIVLAAVTGSRLLVLPAVLAASLQFLGDATELGGGTLDPETVGRRILALGLVGIVLVLIPASFLSATAAGLLRDWRWTMRRVDDDLHISRGLLSTRESVLPLARVQLVEVQRNWVRRGLGVAAIRVHSAGGSSGDDRRVTIPLVRDEEVDRLVGALLPGVAGVPMLRAHPSAARRRAVFRWVRASLLPAAALLALPGLVGPLRGLGAVLPFTAALLGLVEYGQLAHGRSDRVLAARSGALSVTTGLAPLVKVQGVTRTASPFQRRLGLATLTAHVAGPGGDLTVLDLGADAATTLHRGLIVAASDAVVPASTPLSPNAPGSVW